MSDPTIRAVVPGPPVPKARPRVVGKRAYTPAATLEAERRVAWAVKAVLPRDREWPSREPWAALVRFYFGGGAGRLTDGDNALKLILDALIGIVWKSDRQVVDVHYTVVRGCAEPRTEIALWETEQLA